MCVFLFVFFCKRVALCCRVLFELLWRDYFRFVALKHGRRIFSARGACGSLHPEGKGTVLKRGKEEKRLQAL